MLGPVAGTLLYEWGPGAPYLSAGILLTLAALWCEKTTEG